MVSASDTVDRPAATVDRGGFLVRLGAVIIGAAAAGTLASQQKAFASPVCCSGLPSCGAIGHSCCCGSNDGCCCWWCQVSGTCHLYSCCDRFNGGLCNFCGTGQNCNCICSYLVCSGCC
jgi:hypothetical protein